MAKQRETLIKVVDDLLDGRTQKWLSDQANLSTAKVSRIMSGEADPSISDLMAIGEALGIRGDEILRLAFYPAKESMSDKTRERSEKIRLAMETQQHQRGRVKIAIDRHAPHATETLNPDVSGGIAILSKFSALPPVFQSMVMTLLYQDRRFVEGIPVGKDAISALEKLLGPILKSRP